MAVTFSIPNPWPLHDLVEPLFLDMNLHEVATNTAVVPVVEPWATMYVDAIRDGRYGDAIWARYHIHGEVVDGVFPGDYPNRSMTVLERIEEDALEALGGSSDDFYQNALELYRQTKDTDGHQDVIRLLERCASEAIGRMKLREDAH